MRITEIQLRSFGIWRDATFRLDAPLTCFYGPNEAGKSTLMGFIRSVLFGFPTRARLAERFEPFHGGVHGGMLTLVDAQGRRMRIERSDSGVNPHARARSAAGIVRVSRDDGISGGEAELQQLLGGITAELFRSLFAFSLSELQEVRSLQSDEISAYLFNSGFGAGGHVIMQAERRLAAEMDQLYKLKGTKQEINQLLKQMEEKDQDIRKSKENIGQFNQYLQEISTLEDTLLLKDLEFKQLQAELEWLQKCRHLREPWMHRLELNRALDELPAGSGFPKDAIIRFETLAAEKERVSTDYRHKQIQLEKLQHKLDNSPIRYDILEQKTTIVTLIEQVNSYEEGSKTTIELRVELEFMTDDLKTLLRQINDAWTEDTLAQFSVSVALREQVRSYNDNFARQTRELERLEADVRRISEDEEKAHCVYEERVSAYILILEQKNQEFSWIAHHSETEIAYRWNQLKQEYEQSKQLAEKLAFHKLAFKDLQTSHDLFRKMTQQQPLLPLYLWIGILLNMLAPVIVWLLTENKAMTLISFFILAAANILMYVFRLHSGPAEQFQLIVLEHGRTLAESSDEIELLEKRIHTNADRVYHFLLELVHGSALHQVEAAAGSEQNSTLRHKFTDWRGQGLNLNSVTDEFMEELQQSVEQLQKVQGRIKQETVQNSEHESAWKVLQGNRNQAQRKEKEQVGNLAELQQDWSQWLQQHVLEENLTPESVMEIFQYAEQAIQILQQRNRCQAKLTSVMNRLTSYESSCHELFSSINEQEGAREFLYTLKQISEQLEQHSRLLEQKSQIEAQQEQIHEELELIQEILADKNRRIYTLWQEAEAEHEEQFRSNAHLHRKHNELLDKLRHVQIMLETGLNEDKQLEMNSVLHDYDDIQLTTLIELKRSRTLSLEDELNGLREHRGRIDNELERLQLGEEHSRKIHQFEEQQSSLDELAKRWAVLALCSELISKAKEIYERERQPGVLLRATDYFHLITEGAYRRVMAPLGENKIIVERHNGQQVDTAYLSRGTAEQLYLAMRFALADEYAANRKVVLPFVMDDIFVNFDSTRLKNTLALVAQVSQKHQIVLFTCHPHVERAVSEAIPNYQSIHL